MKIKKANFEDIKEVKKISKKYKFELQGSKEMYILIENNVDIMTDIILTLQKKLLCGILTT